MQKITQESRGMLLSANSFLSECKDAKSLHKNTKNEAIPNIFNGMEKIDVSTSFDIPLLIRSISDNFIKCNF